MSVKKIGIQTASISTEAVAALCTALDTRYAQFKFTVMDGQVVADGPWERKAIAGPDGRPAMGDMARWGEGYVQCMVDNAAAIGAYEEPAVLTPQ